MGSTAGALIVAGKTVGETAAILGLDESTARRHAKREGVSRLAWLRARSMRAAGLRAQGYTFDEIARMFGYGSRSTARQAVLRGAKILAARRAA